MARVAFRADRSGKAGAGHAIRCGALAAWLERLGVEAEFIEGEAASAADWVVTDDYRLDAAWESRARAWARGILALDDSPSRRHDCDLLLDAGGEAAGDAWRPLVPAQCRLLLGPRHALLRPEFAARRRGLQRGAGDVARVLVFFGAADRARWTPRAVAAARAALPRAQIDTITGADGTDRMHELMATADLAIGAAGSATWERCSLGLPQLLITVAPNQVAVAATVSRAGAARILADGEDLAREISALARDRDARQRMSAAGMQLVDAKGTQRVAEAMFPLELRRAAESDKRLLWEWANDRAVRDNAFNPEPIAWEDHQRWFAKRLSEERCRIYIGAFGGAPFGQVRFEPGSEGFEIDISVAATRRGLGLGGPLLEAAIARFLSDNPRTALVADVLPGNNVSAELFARHGFKRTHADASHTRYRRHAQGD